MKKSIYILLLSLPLLCLAKPTTVEQLFSVQTIQVKKEIRSERIKNYGYVKMDQTRIYDVAPRFGGYVVKLYANKIYQKVRKGDALAEVYSPEVFNAKDE